MRFYLDDDSVHTDLVRILGAAGHDVLVPHRIGKSGAPDAIQLTISIHEDRVLLTGNHDDFEDLHKLVLQAKGRHAGILVVRSDNDARRDLSIRGIANAIRKLLNANIPVANEFIILNHWR
jgi:predicted nuclease of predicted toxin-antitoxin system